MSETIKVYPVKGSTVYKLDGTQGTYIEELSTGAHLVSVVYYVDNQLGDGEYEFDMEEPHIEIWDRVYSNPPKAQKEGQLAKLDIDIANRQKALSDIEDRLHRERQELLAFCKEQISRKETIKQHKALANLELFIQGKITHFLKVNGASYEILPFEKGLALSEDNRRYDNGKFKLLTLYGKTDGNLEWNINEYSSDSYNKVLVYPCTSYEDAEAKVLEIWHEKLANLKRDDRGLIFICETAKKLGIALKEDVTSWYYEVKRDELNRQINSTAEQIKTYNHNVKLLEERLIELNIAWSKV